jgi:multisubunit Na+/H+ antiporter MnhG subunit
MMGPPDLKEIERRPLKHWNVDGLPELLIGVIWLVSGGLWLAGDLLPDGAASNVYRVVTPILMVGAAFLGKWMVFKLKRRITYPRVGYVRAKGPGKREFVGLLLLVLGLAAAVIFTPRPLGASTLAPVILAVAWRMQAQHLLWIVPAPIALGIYAYLTQVGSAPWRWMFVFLGAVCAMVGAVRLRRFLKRHQEAAETGA